MFFISMSQNLLSVRKNWSSSLPDDNVFQLGNNGCGSLEAAMLSSEATMDLIYWGYNDLRLVMVVLILQGCNVLRSSR